MTRIRKSPTMTGPFAEVAQEFIQYKRSAGFKYADEPKCLSRFCRFSEELGITEIEISRSLAEKWIAPRESESEKSRSHRITCIRQFAIYLNNLGYDAYIVPEVKGLNHNSFVPYIFTHEQIASVIKAADETEPREVARNMHLALPVIFRILYGCGLRVSDRYIPLSDSVKEACISYADKIWWEKDSDFFFLAPDKTMISPMTVYQRYRRYLEVAGISHGGKGQGPRLHDIRHTFAVHVLQKWIKEEADLTAMLPILSTYMGHKTVRSTAQYLRLTAEVYPDLMKRVEKSCAYVIPEVCHEGN